MILDFLFFDVSVKIDLILLDLCYDFLLLFLCFLLLLNYNFCKENSLLVLLM